MSPILTLNNISKSFESALVLSDISLSLYPGQIVSIVGENGAGKSTLGKIIAGHLRPDSGTLSFNDKPISFLSPVDALNHGIALVHQEICLAENLTIAENLTLGREVTRTGFLAKQQIAPAATQFLNRLGEKFALNRRVDTLALADKQLVEVARALACNAQVIIFDEPTASLSAHETDILLAALVALKKNGRAIVFISHRLPEIIKISDQVFGLRDGKKSGSLSRQELSRDAIMQIMIGRTFKEFFPYHERKIGEVVLELRNFQASSNHLPLDLSLRQGEIVAIAGLVGSGRSELLEAMYGIRAAKAGTVHVAGETFKAPTPTRAVRAGLRLVPESRKEQGLALDTTIHDSVALNGLVAAKNHVRRNFEIEAATTEYLISRLGIKCTDRAQKVRFLSGGNQQKVVLSRCFIGSAQVILLDEPTRGIDLSAKQDIYQVLFELSAEGAAILFVSSELEEVMGIADRAIVLANGARAGELLREEFSEQAFMRLAAATNEELS